MQIIANYSEAGRTKAERAAGKTLILAVFGGLIIAFGSASVNTAVCTIASASAARVAAGLLFPFGLGIIMILGAELFTGNCMIPVSVLDGNTTAARTLRNWALVYAGNFTGALALAAGCALAGQLDFAGGELAVYTIKTAATKCAIPFGQGVVKGFFCNVLVCAGVLCSLSATNTAGKVVGAYIPVALFVICGFEHSVANMYFIPAGLFAMGVPGYAELARGAGVNTASLTWWNFIARNLLPVTIGNIAGGMFIGLGLRAGHNGR